MTAPEQCEVVSRRAHPSKTPLTLSQEAIVSTGLSLRKVAAVLDTGPASSYVYLADLGQLHALVLLT